MRRKAKNKVKLQKKPVYKPFDEAAENYMLPMDEEFHCVQDSSEEDVQSMSLEELEVLEDSLVDDMMDYDTIIEMQLDPNKSNVGFDSESLKMDRQRRQKIVVELRTVRDRIKMLKYGNKEVAIAA